MEENEIKSLYIFLANFKLSQTVKIVHNDNIIYEGTIGKITVEISNMAYVKENSVYIDNGVVIIPIRYEQGY